jgi:hypothetical protein
MAISAVQVAHSTQSVTNSASVDKAQAKPTSPSQPLAASKDRVTISAAAQSKQSSSAGDKDHDGDSK